MLYEDAQLTISDLNQIPLSQALKIFEPRAQKINIDAFPDFESSVRDVARWIQGNVEYLSEFHKEAINLPEMQWSDLPGDLFGLFPDK
ncbi:hypothetical protein HV011_13905 [Citrobacter freundii]|uniref:hypothetical protein n=1 Tax=Citrobacter freundii TaxID=546 RepID=UPI0015E9C03C|nr:hypothetical protein [Citrobacter freundii]QMB06622.1 hypothetical protein HV011_13905 [Citrobacter freundii]